MPSIIGEQKYGFMKNRFVGNYGKIVADNMDITTQKKLMGFIGIRYEKSI